MRHYLYLIFSYTDLNLSPTTSSCIKVLSFYVTVYCRILYNEGYYTHIWLHCIGDFFDAQFMLSRKTLRVYVNLYTASMIIPILKFNIRR